jgi:hypothetical protein
MDGTMTTRDTIKQGIAELAWWIAWSDHTERHDCYNLSGCEISEHAPPVPAEAFQAAEKALAKVESRIGHHEALQQAIRAALGCGDVDGDEINEAAASEACGALLAAAVADGDPSLYNNQEYALRFGRCIAHSLCGSGVSWSDDHAEIPWPDLYDTSLSDAIGDLADSLCNVDTSGSRSWPI